MNTSLLRGVVVTAGILAWVNAGGHHAASANFTENVGTVEGVVVDVFWSNPHVNYYVEVTEPDGSTRTWTLESHNLSTMARFGWSRDTVEVADHIRITGFLGRESRARLLIVDPKHLDSLEVLE